MPDELQVWETEGGYSPPEPSITCRLCGDDRGPKIKQLEGWVCLVHLPNVADRRRSFLR